MEISLLGSLLFCIFKVVCFGFFPALFFVSVSALVLGLALPILKHLPGGQQTALLPSYMSTFSLTRENSFVATREVPLLLDVALKLLGGK